MTWMKALMGVWNFCAFPDIVDALALRTGLSISKKSCRDGLHQKTEIVARDLVHPSTEKMLLSPRASATIASLLSAMLPHSLPLRLLFFNHRGSFICFQIFYPLTASVGTFSSSCGQPAPKTELSSDPHVKGSCLHKNFHLQPLKPGIMQELEYTCSVKDISLFPLLLNHSEIQ